MIKRNDIRLIPAVLVAGLTLVFFAVVLHAVLIARVHHQARVDVQSTARDFVQFSGSREADSAHSLLVEFIEQHPVSTDEALVGITPEQLIQSDWAEQPLDSGDALVVAATNNPEATGVVEKTEGPVYWASVEIETTDSSLLIARFTGMDIHHTQRLIRMVVSLAVAGVTVVGMLWWFFPKARRTPRLVEGNLSTVGKSIGELSGLELALPSDPRVTVRVDVSALGTALRAAADFCRGTAAGVSIRHHTVTLWVHSPDTQLTSHHLNTTFNAPEMRPVLDASQRHGGVAWVESAPRSGCTIGIDLPIHQDRRNHAHHH
ncbi:hypothetical protein HMPREF0290_2488 [Corynebacterium efficiens YS-314]|uniref:Uncharacterized protein n=1 Tax=Corynebacterium efficiens (strain DSM 44549 / YS-314 / AJ 12310 / JCM 11189 / NBRC 100395) TaxID=196164 RepID=Q8FTY4_COREF|nr:hypothetical protein [Corynebacterium efficiens]EEW48845.1 hypothetical protein HMPREF0290_2488 [Corynebacterium efficiens YS-314]BAC17048.1 hypothetical protein [Corynebacterium efficiens YS-314]